jgi:chromosome segregation ATPase
MEENTRMTEEYKEAVRENECVMGLLERKDRDISELKKEIVRLNEEKEAIIGQIPGQKKKRSAFFANTCSYPSP